MKIYLVMLFLLVTGGANGQTAIAKLKFEDAQENYQKADYANALNKLNEAEKLFGESNVPILHLRVLLEDKLFDRQASYERGKATLQYANDFLAKYSNEEGIEQQIREVYKIQQKYLSISETETMYKTYLSKINDEKLAKEREEKDKLMSIPVKVYIVRATGYNGVAGKFSVFIDKILVAEINNTNYVALDVLPGKHLIEAAVGQKTKDKHETLEVNLEPGKEYYYKMRLNAWNAKLRYEEISREELFKYKPQDRKQNELFGIKQ